VAVPKSTEWEISLAGRRLVFRAAKTIRILDTTTGAHSVLAVAQGSVFGLSIEGRRVAWGESFLRKSDVIRTVMLPG
jgi:hypothetical protein